MGNKTQALQEISSAVTLCRQQPRLLESHGPQLHTLLGLYSMSMNCMEVAEAQFKSALRVCIKYLYIRKLSIKRKYVVQKYQI